MRERLTVEELGILSTHTRCRQAVALCTESFTQMHKLLCVPFFVLAISSHPARKTPFRGWVLWEMLKCCFKILSEVYVASSTKSKKIPDLLWEEFHLIQLDTHLIIY